MRVGPEGHEDTHNETRKVGSMPCVSRFRSTILAGAALSVMLWLLQADGGEAERVIEPQFSTHSISLLKRASTGLIGDS